MYVIVSSSTGPVSAFGPYGDETEAMSAGDAFLTSNEDGGDETSLSVRVLTLDSKVES
jgi:hypothetical protein